MTLNHRTNHLRLVKGSQLSANLETLIKLFKAYIRPVLEVGAVLTADNKQSLAKLQIIQNKVIRMAYNLPLRLRIPIPDLHHIANLEMLNERIALIKEQTLDRFSDSLIMHELANYLQT